MFPGYGARLLVVSTRALKEVPRIEKRFTAIETTDLVEPDGSGLAGARTPAPPRRHPHESADHRDERSALDARVPFSRKHVLDRQFPLFNITLLTRDADPIARRDQDVREIHTDV